MLKAAFLNQNAPSLFDNKSCPIAFDPPRKKPFFPYVYHY
jgi:hypothetical protein